LFIRSTYTQTNNSPRRLRFVVVAPRAQLLAPAISHQDGELAPCSPRQNHTHIIRIKKKGHVGALIRILQ
jgi:hypothetical protein